MRLVLISGLSGSGKSVGLKVLEDAGFYCIDNLPAALLVQTIEHLRQVGSQDVAVSIDARSHPNVDVQADVQGNVQGKETLESSPALLDLKQDLKQLGLSTEVRVVFLTAREEVLVKRFSETRRRHPLASANCSLEECLRKERDLLVGVSGNAHLIDTSDLSANALRARIKEFLNLAGGTLTLVFESFGFKHGIPMDANLVFDVRCLPNPHYDPALRPLTGRDAAVVAFLQSEAQVAEMLADIRAYVSKWLPAYIRDNRNYFTVALGCTGGQHRSVYFAETLAEHFRASQQVLVRHRELG